MHAIVEHLPLRYSPVPTNWTHEHAVQKGFFWRLLCFVGVCIVTAVGMHVYDRVVSTDPVSFTVRTEPLIDDPDPSAPWPRIAWLLSFPNSGTTYTLNLVSNVTNTTTATNYGLEAQSEGGVPVRQDRDDDDDCYNGPYLRNPDMNLPASYILTKTHCGGRCMYCGPSGYIETARSFELMCRTGSKGVNGEKLLGSYDSAIVSRAVHLIRNPFDNLVARLHMERKIWRNRGEDRIHYLQNFTDSREGLHAWCGHVDGGMAREESSSRLIDKELLFLETRLPCHAEFYRYIQWHNLAFEVTKRKAFPVLVLYYENYTENYQKTATELFQFLKLPMGANGPEFIGGKHYESYFNASERKAAAALLKELASVDSWRAVRHYVEDFLKD